MANDERAGDAGAETPVGAGGFSMLLGAIIVVAAALLANLPGLGERDFWPPDEARYGEVAREMWAGEHPAVPHLNGTIYYDKPPGYFWAVNLAAQFRGGVDEWAVRIPSVAGAVLIALAVFLMLAPRAGRGAGIVGSFLALGTVSLVWQGREAQLDCCFAGLIAMGMAAFFRALDGPRPRATLLGFLFCGLAVLVKGPLCLAMMMGGFIAAVAMGRGRAIFNKWTLPGLLLFLLPTAAWLGWAWLHLEGEKAGSGLEYITTIFTGQIRDRLTGAPAHWKPWYYYLQKGFPAAAAPFLLLPLGLLFPSARYSLTASARRLAWFALSWLVLSLAVQSAVGGKRMLYLVPIMPAMAILGALGVQGVASAWPRAGFRFLGTFTALIALALTLGGLGLVATVDDRVFERGVSYVEGVIQHRFERAAKDDDEDDDQETAAGATDSRSASAPAVTATTKPAASRPAVGSLKSMFPPLRWERIRTAAFQVGVIAFALGLAALATLACGALRASIAWAALGIALAGGLAVGLIAPEFDELMSRRHAAESVRQMLERRPPGSEVGFFQHLDEGFPFYLGRPTPEIASERKPLTEAEIRDQVREFLTRKGSVLIVRGDKLDRYGLRQLAPGRVSAPLRAGSKEFFLIEGQP